MKVAIIEYLTYGHVAEVARAVKQGVLDLGVASQVDLYQVPETLSPEVLALLHAPEKPKDIPVALMDTLTLYDAFLFGIPTRFGNLPAQWIEFWGQTGALWTQGALYGKPAGIFVSTGTPGGGQEATVRNALSYLAHHGLPYIPLGYAKAFPEITSFDEVHGGSPWGAGTYAGPDGLRQPNATELKIARIQGESFAQLAAKLVGATSGAAGAAAGGKKGAAANQQNKSATTGGAAAAGGAANQPDIEPTRQRGVLESTDGSGAGAGAAAAAGAAGAAGVAGAGAAAAHHLGKAKSAGANAATGGHGVGSADAAGTAAGAAGTTGAAGAAGTTGAGAAAAGAAAHKETTIPADGQAVANDLKVTKKVEDKANKEALEKREKQAEKKTAAKTESNSKCSKCIIM